MNHAPGKPPTAIPAGVPEREEAVGLLGAQSGGGSPVAPRGHAKEHSAVSVSALPDRQTKLMLDEPGSDVNYAEETVFTCFRSRVGWLGLFLLGLWSAAFIIDAFEKTLQANGELAHFVPLIIGQGGNAGSQAVSSVIRAMAGKEIDLPSEHSRSAGWVVAKESAVGALCGMALGLFLWVVGFCCGVVSFHVGAVVCISLPLVSLWANFLGSALPLLAVRLRRNPAVTSAPLMTTIIDSTGLLIYFYVAMFYMPYAQGHQAEGGHHGNHHGNHHNSHIAAAPYDDMPASIAQTGHGLSN